MGYMGLAHWNDSDMTAGLRSTVVDALVKALNVGMKEVERHGTNTCGIVNVALFLESGALDPYAGYEVEDLNWKKLIEGLEKYIKESNRSNAAAWNNDEDGRIMHNLAYKRMLRSVKTFMDRKELKL